MQNAGIAALGLDWRYLAFDVHPEHLRAAISGAKTMKFVGLNLTLPHKLLAIAMVDVLDPSAKEWGAVNTIRFEARGQSGDWLPVSAFTREEPDIIRSVGFNTDAAGLAVSLREDLGLHLAGARVALLGAGGAGRSAAIKFAAEGAAELFLINRTQSKAEEVAREIRQRFPAATAVAGYPQGRVDLLLNATSLGLEPDDAMPLDEKKLPLKNVRAVCDIIYRPAETALLRSARAAGCRTANGLGMLLHQGALALEIWSGRPAPLETMRQALKKDIYGE
jgi:shikimate dehydrogenase